MNPEASSPPAHEQTPIAEQRWCEACGYRVDGIADELPCPECGRGVGLSDPALRTGSAWQRGASIWSWVVSAAGVFRRPRGFWDGVTVDRWAAHRLGQLNALLAAGIGVGIPAFVLRDAILFIVLMPLALGAVWLMTVVECAGLRFWGRVHGSRITRDVAWAVCGHASFGWVVGGVLAAVGWVVGQFDATTGFYHIGQSGRVAVLPFGSAVYIVIGCVVGLLVFETLAYLGVRRMRFANRPAPADQSVSAGTGAEVRR